MNKSLFKLRRCRYCRNGFKPVYANQRTHKECFRLWRRKYHRLYQRKVRRDLKRRWEEPENHEA